jgi:hypothetical protein
VLYREGVFDLKETPHVSSFVVNSPEDEVIGSASNDDNILIPALLRAKDPHLQLQRKEGCKGSEQVPRVDYLVEVEEIEESAVLCVQRGRNHLSKVRLTGGCNALPRFCP